MIIILPSKQVGTSSEDWQIIMNLIKYVLFASTQKAFDKVLSFLSYYY